MAVQSLVRSRVDRSRLALGLALGDVLAITGFVVAGEVRHGRDPLASPGVAAETVLVFLAGWALAALLGGLYTRDALKNVRRVLSWTVPAWVFATLLIHGAIALVSFHGGTELAFVAVTLFVGGSIVVGWRLLGAVIAE